MALLGSRDISETQVDDQSPTLHNSYVGNWTHYYDGNTTKWYFGTYTATTNPGDSFSFDFSGTSTIYGWLCLRANTTTRTGTQLWLYGGVSDANIAPDGSFISYPNANYWLDGSPGEFISRPPLVNNLRAILHSSRSPAALPRSQPKNHLPPVTEPRIRYSYGQPYGDDCQPE